MKKYLYAGLLACTIASCTDDFLKEEMVSTITQDYFNTAARTGPINCRYL